ncbi:hypothetical protein [Kribbella rubisoli]|uniref:hypothetical protein n=1 Tax=Kribbella rubisoli TaxID=3075929 RepID=UPI00102CECD1|nr:hypothetical protein [Kribbella rubisoli]
MCICSSVLYEGLTVASRAATSQLRVELLQGTRSEFGEQYVSQRWADRPLSELAIPIEGGLIGFMDFEPRVERVRERFGRGGGAGDDSAAAQHAWVNHTPPPPQSARPRTPAKQSVPTAARKSLAVVGRETPAVAGGWVGAGVAGAAEERTDERAAAECTWAGPQFVGWDVVLRAGEGT